MKRSIAIIALVCGGCSHEALDKDTLEWSGTLKEMPVVWKSVGGHRLTVKNFGHFWRHYEDIDTGQIFDDDGVEFKWKSTGGMVDGAVNILTGKREYVPVTTVKFSDLKERDGVISIDIPAKSDVPQTEYAKGLKP